jgi:hypothetical protein
MMTHVQVGTGPILAEASRVLGPAWIEKAGEELVGGIVLRVRVGIVCIESDTVTRPLFEIN